MADEIHFSTGRARRDIFQKAARRLTRPIQGTPPMAATTAGEIFQQRKAGTASGWSLS